MPRQTCFRRFLRTHAAEREVQFFVGSATTLWPPEYACRIGFLLYLAFVVTDIVIANVLLAMGLSQGTPTNVAIPFKLLLFVTLDGWSRLMHGLVLTYK